MYEISNIPSYPCIKLRKHGRGIVQRCQKSRLEHGLKAIAETMDRTGFVFSWLMIVAYDLHFGFLNDIFPVLQNIVEFSGDLRLAHEE